MLKLPAHPRNARRDPGERGFALITVLLATMMLLALASAALAYGVGSQPISRHDQDWNGALGAAQAGVDDYLARINQNQTYITSYSSSNPDPTNPAMGCSSGACPGTPKWATMSSGGQFHYGIDTSQYAQNGVIFVTATGRAAATGPGAGVMRTIQARLGRSGLLKFLYHTTYETLDPAWQGKLLGSGPFRDPYTGTMVNGQTWANDVCGGNSAYASKAYWWAGRYKYSSYNPPGPSSGAFCQDIQFAPGDVVNGPLSTDDTPVICGGATFNGAVTVGGKDPYQGKLWFNPGCGGGPNFTQGPPTVKSLPLPSTLASLKSYVTTSSGGCLYTGPTRIYLSMQGGVSGMRVQSPLSQNTVNPSQCPTGTSTSLSSWVPVPGAPKVGGGNYPGNGLILVQNVPASTTDPNYTSPSSSACTSWPKSAVSYYMAGDPSATKSCTDGDAFVQGTVNTAATIAAVDNSIVITHDSGGTRRTPASATRARARAARSARAGPPRTTPTPRACSASRPPTSSRCSTPAVHRRRTTSRSTPPSSPSTTRSSCRTGARTTRASSRCSGRSARSSAGRSARRAATATSRTTGGTPASARACSPRTSWTRRRPRGARRSGRRSRRRARCPDPGARPGDAPTRAATAGTIGAGTEPGAMTAGR